ncbi:MAG: hypothetical protein M3Q45_01875 [Chloroflexota bacterium]|nr:hypothetical protein [Chloroflexota bacterium]
MTKVTILPVPTSQGATAYYAMAGEKQSFGCSAGEALDGLTQVLARARSEGKCEEGTGEFELLLQLDNRPCEHTM